MLIKLISISMSIIPNINKVRSRNGWLSPNLSFFSFRFRHDRTLALTVPSITPLEKKKKNGLVIKLPVTSKRLGTPVACGITQSMVQRIKSIVLNISMISRQHDDFDIRPVIPRLTCKHEQCQYSRHNKVADVSMAQNAKYELTTQY
jgi:hypothetical protein